MTGSLKGIPEECNEYKTLFIKSRNIQLNNTFFFLSRKHKIWDNGYVGKWDN